MREGFRRVSRSTFETQSTLLIADLSNAKKHKNNIIKPKNHKKYYFLQSIKMIEIQVFKHGFCVLFKDETQSRKHIRTR
jgi:hypothetical protein